MGSLRNLLIVIVASKLLSLSSVIYAQDKSLEWINKNAYELHSDSTYTNQDFGFLSKILKGKTLVGLGEASHGTHEFYFQKSRIIKHLVSKDKYKLIALESVTTFIDPINNYIQTGKGDLRSILQPMGLYNTDEIYKLCQWLKSFNESRSPHDKVKIIGFDDQSYWNDPFTRDEKMAEKFINAHKQDNSKCILWAHNLHLAKDTTMAQYKAMGYHLKKQYGNDYYAIVFDTFSGSVSVLNNNQFESHDFTGSENTFSNLFSKANMAAFFINFIESSNPLLNTKNSITNIYSNWQGAPKPLPIVAGADFDGLIFIRETTASKSIP